jgi:myo-inositol 2-dehydrogenase / D-chiro-inositol 1-dehydrogenase
MNEYAKMDSVNVAFLGAGRMGQTHLRNLVGLPGVQVRVVADNSLAAAEQGAAIVRAERASDDVLAAITAPDVDAVLICTPTDSHAALIEAAARARKPVWCEKPVALTLEETRRVAATVAEAQVPAMVGFMRRFDPGYAEARRRIEAGELGRIERFRALSCDFKPPPLSYVRTSGGIFVDMSVHDFDLARFLVGEVAEVSAWGAALIEPGFAEAGDVDTSIALLRFQNGAIGSVEASRRTTWGYDIRTEVAGSLAKLVVEAPQKTPLRISRDLGATGDHFESFPDRFEVAYRAEMAYFFACLRAGTPPEPGIDDALASLRVALAASRSIKEGRAVRVDEIV